MSIVSTSRTRFTLIVATAIAALALTGCSSGAAAPDDSARHNKADVSFTMEMVPHHQQAVEMADMLLTKDGIDSRVVTLARKIKAEQTPEISTMKSGLKAWGTPMGGMSGMSGMGSNSGMMSDSDMSALDAATGLVASKLFLQQMTQHHDGAITMAKGEIDAGENAGALSLAKRIVTSQSAEISTMRSLLATL